MSLQNHSSLMILLGGVAFFMYGMSLASDFLQRLAANRVRELLGRLSDRHWLAILVGITLTILLQSSGAVTSMLVGLGSAEVISLNQVMGVIIGTAVGSTLTVQLISFNLTQYGLPIFLLGFTTYFVLRGKFLKDVGGVVMGFGLIFVGLEMMGLGTAAFKEHPIVVDVFGQFKGNPLLSIFLTAVFTAFVHSSAVTIGLAMSLASSGVISIYDAMFWVYGANVGTTSTALFAAVSSNYIGRQVAWAHFFYKVGSVVIFLGFTEVFANYMQGFTPDPLRAIANAHTVFNIVSAVVFYPFIGLGARKIEEFFPRSASEKEFGPKYITRDTYDNPTLALEKANRETMRMGDIFMTMLQDSIALFQSDNPDLCEDIRKRDSQVDLLYREIKMFMVKYTEHATLSKNVIHLISYVSDLESAADVIDKAVVDLAKKKGALKLEFSEKGWRELRDYHRQVVEVVSTAQSCFHLHDVSLAKMVIDRKRELRALEKQLKESHLERLTQGLVESINTSSIHLDLLGDYRRIVGLVANHTYSLTGVQKSS